MGATAEGLALSGQGGTGARVVCSRLARIDRGPDMNPSIAPLALALCCGCHGHRDSSATELHDSAPLEDTAGPELQVPDGLSWRGWNDQRLGAALAVGPGATLVISGPSRGSEYWEDTSSPKIYLLDETTGDVRRDAFATLLGGWVDESGAPYYATRIGTEVVLPGDVTGDGEPDVLLFTDPGDGDLDEPAYLYPGPHSGEMNITDPAVQPVFGPDGWNGTHCGDLDGNGVDELCLSSGVVFGPVGPAAELSLTWSGTAASDVEIAAADLDGDGVKELLVADGGASSLVALSALEPGDLELASAAWAAWTTPAGEAQAILAGDDLDGDGEGDIALAWSDGRSSAVYLLTSTDGGVVDEAATTIRVPATAMTVGDFDGDGSQDLAVGGEGSVRAFAGPLEAGVFEARCAAAQLVGTQHPDDGFGHALETLRIDGSSSDQLVVGAPDTLEDGGSNQPYGMVFRVAAGWL